MRASGSRRADSPAMIASLPMYTRPELRAANAAFWVQIRDALRARGLEAPDTLDLEIGVWEAWESPQLCFSQTCNFPYRARLHDAVTLIGAADYGLEGAAPGHYYSEFVVRSEDAGKRPEDFATARFAFNEGLSQSGWASPQNWAASRGFEFPASLQTGAHLQSARAVADGRADIAAIDAVTWRLLQRYEGFAAGLTAIGRTDHTPALSFITRAGQDPAPYRDAITQAIAALAPEHRQAIGIEAVIAIPAATYLAIPTPPAPRIGAPAS